MDIITQKESVFNNSINCQYLNSSLVYIRIFILTLNFWFDNILFHNTFHVSGMVRFDTNPERYNTVKMLRHLETDVENLISLDNHISTMEEEIRVNPKFVKIHGNTGSSGGMGGRGGAVSAEIDDEIILPSAGRGSRSGSLGPSSSSNVNSNNFNFTC